jgi:hypothetical protein
MLVLRTGDRRGPAAAEILGFAALLLILALVSPSLAHADQPVDRELFAALRGPTSAHSPIVVNGLPLDASDNVSLHLQRFEVFTEDAVVVERGQDGERRTRPRSDLYYRGTVGGDPESMAVIAVGARVRGFVATRGEVFALSSGTDAYHATDRDEVTVVRRIDPGTDRPARNRQWRCGGDLLPPPDTPLSSFVTGSTSTQALLSSVVYRATLAIDTDFELYTMLGSTSAVTTYVGDLVAAASAIYERDVKTQLQVGTLYVYSTSSDPWSATDTLGSLFEVGTYWHTNHAGVARDTVAFLSGKDMGGGIAWVEVLCDPDFFYDGNWGGGYSVIASLNGEFSTTNPALYWDIFGFTHELGHNFASPHTHCYEPPVDICYNSQTGCYNGDEVAVPPEKGTIMSYCHLRSGGYANLKLFLGVPGETSEAVSYLIRTYVESKAGCLEAMGDPPTVTAVVPAQGPTAGGTAVTITGTRFAEGLTVTLGGASAIGVAVVDETTITCSTAAHAAGTVDVVVTNPDGLSGTLVGGFTYGSVLHLDRSALVFGGTNSGNTTTASQAVAVTFTGSGTASWTATCNRTWILVSPTSGSGNGPITVSIKAGTTASGSGTVTVTAAGAAGSPKTVAVTYNYCANGTSLSPFGQVDTPTDGVTGVTGQIPVTGWALDDIEVERVDVWRAPLPGEPVHPNGLVYIGDAVLVPGARPDVEAAYPTSPLSYRAGWGFALLTNMLPDGAAGTTGGNGTFVLHVYATDKDGHTALLGSRTITCDNTNAATPFGTIDTPSQGQEVSGTVTNFGWALTPPPATIPTDGSTIWVYVDGVPLGHPVYNNYRADIATLFPGYTNSDGAIGYYFMDTTALANGMHEIAWSVTDNQSRVNGIGSRYFWVRN